MQKQWENTQVPTQGLQSRIWVAVASLAFAGLVMIGCGKSSAGAAPGAMGPMPVTVVRIQPSDVGLAREWVGTLDGYVNAQIQPQVSGYMVRQNYREGSTVEKGQVLFEIDPRPFQAALEQAQGQYGQAQGQLGQAQAQLELAQINLKPRYAARRATRDCTEPARQ